MTVLEQILEYYPQSCESVKIPDFDHCIIGFDEIDNRLVYDISLMIGSLIDDGMTEEESQDFINNNVLGSDVISVDGPIFIHTFKLEL